MSKQLICPFAFNRKIDQVCIEENCALWVVGKVIEKETSGVDNSMTTYSPIGACALKAMAFKGD